jgi:hypothetical protein
MTPHTFSIARPSPELTRWSSPSVNALTDPSVKLSISHAGLTLKRRRPIASPADRIAVALVHDTVEPSPRRLTLTGAVRVSVAVLNTGNSGDTGETCAGLAGVCTGGLVKLGTVGSGPVRVADARARGIL